MKAVFKKKEEVAKLTLYTEFDLQGQQVSFKPGQFFYVTLKPDDETHKDELTHHFSIVNSPNEKEILAFTTRLRLNESLFKRTLHEAKVGDEVEIGKIDGEFLLPDETDKPIVLIALGIGITPYMSMLKHSFEENKNYKFTLIYSDDELESMAFLDELKQMAKERENLELALTVTSDDSWQGESRHIDEESLNDFIDDIKGSLFYVSGPPKVVMAVAENLKTAGASEDNIMVDKFSGY